MAQRLQEFRDLVKDVVSSACRTRLFEAGFVPDDFLQTGESAMGTHFFPSTTQLENPFISHLDHLSGGPGGFSVHPDSMDIDTLAQPPDKATYAEQANKRNHCRRLTK